MSFPNDVIIFLAKDVSVYSNISPMWFGHLGLHHLGFQTISIHDFGKSFE